MPNWLFTTPTVEEGPAGSGRLFSFYKLDKGVTIVRLPTGNYAQLRYPVDSELELYPEVFRGGYKHVVNDATRENLINANIGITQGNFTQL